MADNRKYLQTLSENIRESFSYVRAHGFIDESEGKVEKLINLVESFTIMSNLEGDSDFIAEARRYEDELVDTIKIGSAMNRMFEYGFENPFDTDDDDKKGPKIGFNSPAPELAQSRRDVEIKRVRLWKKETKDKIVLDDSADGKKMIAGQYYDKGDIIERCPCNFITKGFYTEDVIEDLAFKVGTETYVIPLGYANCYRNSVETGELPNADYIFDPNKGKPYINIFATRKIKKGSEIVLKADESDFENVIKKGQFDYSNQPVYTPTKNFTFGS